MHSDIGMRCDANLMTSMFSIPADLVAVKLRRHSLLVALVSRAAAKCVALCLMNESLLQLQYCFAR